MEDYDWGILSLLFLLFIVGVILPYILQWWLMMSEKLKEHPCIQCEMVKWKFPHPIYVCGVDEHEAIAIIDLEQALDHLYKECPKQEDKELTLNVETLGGDY